MIVPVPAARADSRVPLLFTCPKGARTRLNGGGSVPDAVKHGLPHASQAIRKLALIVLDVPKVKD